MTKARALQSQITCGSWSASRPTVAADSREGIHDAYAIALQAPEGHDGSTITERAIRALREYRIFPAHRMRYAFCPSSRELTSGTTIVQRVFVGPIAVEMAVRVIDVFDRRGDDRDDHAGDSGDSGGGHGEGDDRRIGFTYVTLDGHMERGVATFSLCLSRTNGLTFHIESWSRPGHWLASLARPFARAVQKQFTQEALVCFAAVGQVAEGSE